MLGDINFSIPIKSNAMLATTTLLDFRKTVISKTVISKGIVNRVAEPLIFVTFPLQTSRFSQSSKKRYR